MAVFLGIDPTLCFLYLLLRSPPAGPVGLFGGQHPQAMGALSSLWCSGGYSLWEISPLFLMRWLLKPYDSVMALFLFCNLKMFCIEDACRLWLNYTLSHLVCLLRPTSNMHGWWESK